MQHRSPRAAAVGVDLGTSTTTVSIRGRGERSATRVFDGLPPEAAAGALAAAFDRVRSFLDESEAGRAPVTVVVPASWERDRLNEVADAAEASGLERPSFLPSAEAAAVYVEARGHEFEPGTALVVYELGASTCEVGVVRRDRDGRTVLAAHATGDIGGDEFDHLVLAYLSGRHRDTDPEFWDRVMDPSEEVLRPALLEEIGRARERLSEQPSADIALDGLELQLTQQELESCIDELVEQSCELAARVLAAAGVGAEETAGLLLTGGASRTPLV
ncbi:Hsp70 family protein, partial [Glycomyces tenuis]